jgi:PHD/YefM family antitoxin component YafN of YafNO toxin-antitoxin module
MTGITATEARSNLYRLIDEAAEFHLPIIIMGRPTRDTQTVEPLS